MLGNYRVASRVVLSYVELVSSVLRSTDMEDGVVEAMNCCEKPNRMGAYFRIDQNQVVRTRGE
jgi:hypothetical protein